MNSVSEKIDERILRLLGLSDVFDLDYDTYLTLIREAMVSGANRFPPEELALLANERKRVRGKKGRFKPKPKKITADNITTTKFLKPSVQPISTPLIAPSAVQAPQSQLVNLSPLQGPLDSIKNTLSSFLNFREGASEDERRNYEAKKRSKREAGLETVKKGMSAVSNAVKKFVSPFQGIIDRIWKFIFFTLLGRAFTQLTGWFKDPKNKKKVETLKRFIKDWWPTLLGAFVLFFTPFGKFVRGILSIVGGLTGKLIGAIPKIAGAIKGLGRVLLNPWVAVPAAAIGLGVAANEITGQRKAASVQSANKARAQTGKGLGVQGTDTMTDKVPSTGSMGPTTPYGLLQGAARGGSVLDGYHGIDHNTGHRISGFGADTQLIAAQPGEIVINKRTVDAVGADTFLGLNRHYGGSGSNQPRFGRLFKNGGVVGSNKVQIPKISAADYHALLAIASLEDDKPQGRADVAQSLYNRLHAASQYGENFLQTSNSLKGIITASKQYQPTFSNSSDWMGITDKKSAAIAVMNSEKGKKYGWSLEDALMQINATESALRNPKLQSQAQKHVGGRPFFLGTSQQKNMKSGDVLRNPTSNFFSPWTLEGSRYDKERRNAAANIPLNLLPLAAKTNPKENKEKLIKKRPWYDPFGWFGGASRTIQKKQGGGKVTENYGMFGERNIPGTTADRQLAFLQPGEYVLPVNTVSTLGTSLIDKLVSLTDRNSNAAKLGKRNINRPQITPLSRTGQGSMVTLPPIVQSASGGMKGASAAGSRVPSFSATSPSGGADERSINVGLYGIVG
jgi:hypothetical protein